MLLSKYLYFQLLFSMGFRQTTLYIIGCLIVTFIYANESFDFIKLFLVSLHFCRVNTLKICCWPFVFWSLAVSL